MSSPEIEARVTGVLSKINAAVSRSSRLLSEVNLVAISKGKPAERIREVGELLEARDMPVAIGESYVQEFRDKRPLLPEKWRYHLVGSVQRNKAKEVVKLFDFVQSLDSLALALALEKEAGKLGRQLDVLVQVNVSHDEHKHGVSPEVAHDFVTQVVPQCPHLRVRGLMAIPKLYDNAEDVRGDFRALKVMAKDLEKAGVFQEHRCELSMGMSADFEIAIEEGATMVRIGTALFGER
jgi:PLP dependent protein